MEECDNYVNDNKDNLHSFLLVFPWLYCIIFSLNMQARLAQSVEHQTFNLRVAGSSPSSGDEIFNYYF